MSTTYQIRLQGHPDTESAECFSDMAIEQQSDRTTCPTDQVADQPALQGLLDRIHRLGL